LSYIATSAELKIFLTAAADLGKQLSNLQVRTKTGDQIFLLRDSIAVNESYEERDLKIFQEETAEFIKD